MNPLILDPTQDPDQDLHTTRPHEAAGEHFHYRVDRDGICWLTFDSPGSPVNVWNEHSLSEFASHLDRLLGETGLRGLILRSAKERIFVAGADLKAFRSLNTAGLEKLVWLGQAAFDRLARLPVPKVALISGACAGGGYEVTLACDHRIAVDDPSTRIGLPETQLGLIPGWGGCTRLPRLIGTRRALDVILKGRLFDAHEALRRGLVDHCAPRAAAEALAVALATQPRKKQRRPWDSRFFSAPIVGRMARNRVLKATRGVYEAPLRAIEAVTRSATRSTEFGLRCERDCLARLAQGDQARHLIDIFLQRESAAKRRPAKGVALPVHHAAVIGAGVMGAGIAQYLASRGVQTLMTDVSPEAVARGVDRVNDLTREAQGKRALTPQQARDTLDALSATHQPVPLAHRQMVIEAATENMALKQKIFAGLARRAAPDTILATNTSALSVTALADATPHPQRVIGLHFFNPVHRMPLVEVVRTRHTTDDVLATAIAFVQKLGKVPVVVRDSPGFVVNRILMPYLIEAARLAESGVPMDRIDNAMLDFGMPMGPLRLLDEIGLDVAEHVLQTLGSIFGGRLPRPGVLANLIAAGHLGKKTGQGFYLHTGHEVRPAFVPPASSAMAADVIQARLALLLSDEADRCLTEGIAQSAADIDLAMVLGTGYAPFRGGPLQYLDSIGRDGARAELEHPNS